MSIKLFITGGTFDKTYDTLRGKLALKQSQVEKVLKQGNCYVDVSLETIFLKDSLDFNETEFDLIVSSCVNSESDKIILIHGTDAMSETTKLIAEQNLKKTIVLTGAMIPFAIKNSDALFNLGAAVSAVQTLKHGVYLTMGGKIFAADNVQKNLATGQFETKCPS